MSFNCSSVYCANCQSISNIQNIWVTATFSLHTVMCMCIYLLIEATSLWLNSMPQLDFSGPATDNIALWYRAILSVAAGYFSTMLTPS